MTNVLIVYGHTDVNESVANKIIIDELKELLPDGEFDFLDELYPNYVIDKEAEQEKLANADIIVLQYPIYWYGMPSLMKRWMEVCFEHGFSHGSNGDKLQGSKLIASFTTGALEQAYQKDGPAGIDIEELLLPLKGASNLCGFEFDKFVYTGGLSYTMRSDPEALEVMKEKSAEHAKRLVDEINSL